MEELDEICNEDSFELYLSAMAEKTDYLTDTDWDDIFQQEFLRSLQWDGDDFGNDTNERNKLPEQLDDSNKMDTNLDDSQEVNKSSEKVLAEEEQTSQRHDDDKISLRKLSDEHLEEYISHLKELHHNDMLYTDNTGCIYRGNNTTEELNKKKISTCGTCGKPALQYSSYGGQACSSCRSFFRRSAQSGKYKEYKCSKKRKCVMDRETRKHCKYCRFQRSLKAGMKVTWVLSEDEKLRRFKKQESRNKYFDTVEFPHHNLEPPFSLEEENVLKRLHSNFKVPWLQHFFLYDREAGINFVQYAYGKTNLGRGTWEKFSKSFHHSFVNFILPSFPEMSTLCSEDSAQILGSPMTSIAKLFLSSYCFNVENMISACPCLEPGVGICSLPFEVRKLKV